MTGTCELKGTDNPYLYGVVETSARLAEQRVLGNGGAPITPAQAKEIEQATLALHENWLRHDPQAPDHTNACKAVVRDQFGEQRIKYSRNKRGLGEQSEAVRDKQEEINKARGNRKPRLAEDGKRGPKTYAAELPGEINKNIRGTRSSDLGLKDIDLENVPEQLPFKLGDRGPGIRALIRKLAEKKVYLGPMDDVFGGYALDALQRLREQQQLRIRMEKL